MWEINSNLQILSFLYSVLTGGIFCFIYDLFKSLRSKLKFSAVSVFFQDIFYSAIISVIAFCFFLIFVNGEIRSYILLGFLIGFLIFRATISKITLPLFKFIFGLILKVFSFFKWLFLRFETFLCIFFAKIKKFLKNNVNRLKKLLKRRKGLLYTNQE